MDAHALDARYETRELVWGLGPNRFVAEECAALAPGRAVDLACGEGRNAIWLAEQGWDALGLDWSPVGIDKSRRLATERGTTSVRFEVADLTADAPTPGGFDLVVIAYLQIPAADRAVVFRNAAAAVAPGGTFLLVGHDGHNLHDGVGGPQDAAVLYEPDDVVVHLDGFVIELAEHVDRPIDGADRPAIDVLVRAHRPTS